MKSRVLGVYSRFADFSSGHSARFASSKAAPSLPHIKAAMFQKIYQPFQATLLENLENEYRHNPICAPLLAQVDVLLRDQQFRVIISPSLAADKDHLEKWKILCGYERNTKALILPSSPGAHQHFFPNTDYSSSKTNYQNPDIKYLCMFLHEANHAHDFIAGGFKLTKADAVALTARLPSSNGMFADNTMRKFERVLGVNYSHDVVNQLKRAFRDDLTRLNEIAENQQHPDQKHAQKAILQMQTSLMRYSVIDLLFEFKSRFIEFSARGSLGAEFMQAMFPAVTHWYLHQHMPACQQALEKTTQLRK